MPPTSVTWWSDPSPPTILSRGGLHFRLQELLSDSLGSINIAAAFFLLRGGSTFTIPRDSFKMLQHPSTTSTDPPRQHRKNPTPSTPTSKLHIVQHHGLLMTVQKVMHLWHKRREPTTTTPPPPPPPLWGVRKTATSFLLLVTSSWCCVSFPLTFVYTDVAWPLLINPS